MYDNIQLVTLFTYQLYILINLLAPFHAKSAKSTAKTAKDTTNQ